MRHHLSRFWTLILALTGVGALLIAGLFIAARLYIGQINEHRESLNRWVSSISGLSVTIASIEGHWSGLAPELVMRGVLVKTETSSDEVILGAGTIQAEPDLLRSLLSGRPIWKHLEINDLGVLLRESAEGHWQIPGLSRQESRGAESLWEMLMRSHQISMHSLRVHFSSFSGLEMDAVLEEGIIENASDFHRLRLNAYIDSPANRAEAVLELVGNPDSLDELEGTGYLQLAATNLDHPFTTLLQRYLTSDIPAQRGEDTRLDMNLWLDLQAGMNLSFSGSLDMQRLPLDWFSERLKTADFSADLIGKIEYPTRIRADFRHAKARWDNVDFPELDFSMVKYLGDRWRELEIRAPQLDLEHIQNSLLKTAFLPDSVQLVLHDLQPQGQLNNAHLTIRLGQLPLEFELQANLANVGVSSHRSSPQAQGIDGFVQVNRQGGFVELASERFSILYPGVYERPFDHQFASGRVDWQLDFDANRYLVFSGPLTIRDQVGEIRGLFRYEGPFKDDGFGAELTLYLASKGLDGRDWQRLTPTAVPQTLRNWLDASIQQANVDEAAFIYRGSVRAGREPYRTIQLGLLLENGTLRYDPNWPLLSGIDAALVVADREIQVSVEEAETQNLQLGDSFVEVRIDPQDRTWLSLESRVQGDASAVLDFLSHSGLNDSLKSALTPFRASGLVQGDVRLKMPLTGGIQREEIEPDITLDLSEIDLEIPEQRVRLEDVTGQLSYDFKGLHGFGLQTRFWGYPAQLTLDQSHHNEPLQVRLNGQVAVESLSEWLSVDLQPYAEGESAFLFAVDFSMQTEAGVAPSPLFHIQSDLEGMALHLPRPLGKTADETSVFSMSWSTQNRSTQMDVRYKGLLSAQLILRDSKWQAGVFGINTQGLPEFQEGKLLGMVVLDELDLTEQMDFWAGLSKGSSYSTAISNGVELLPQIRVETPRLLFQGKEYGKTDLLITRTNSLFNVEFNNAMASGTVTQPEANKPANVHLKQLVMASSEEKQEPMLASVDPRQLPHLNVRVDRFVLDKKELGSWSFEMTPLQHGVSITSVEGRIASLSVEKNDDLSNLLWTYDGETHTTLLNLTAKAEDIGELFTTFNSPPAVTSESGGLYGHFTWQGSPDAFKQSPLAGILGVSLKKGEYMQSVEGAGGAIVRLVSLFNINTWARRLQFDFSDITSKGTVYDETTADFFFQDSNISTLSPVDIRLPSGRMMFDGDFNFSQDTINARLVATLPVRQNVTWVAALLGGVPVAAGVWLASRIFENQLDDLASVGYQITGKISEPEIKIDKVFDSAIEK